MPFHARIGDRHRRVRERRVELVRVAYVSLVYLADESGVLLGVKHLFEEQVEYRRRQELSSVPVLVGVVKEAVVLVEADLKETLFDILRLFAPVFLVLRKPELTRHVREGNLGRIEVAIHVDSDYRRDILLFLLRRRDVVSGVALEEHTFEASAVVVTGVVAVEHFDKPSASRHPRISEPVFPHRRGTVRLFKESAVARHLVYLIAEPRERHALLRLTVADELFRRAFGHFVRVPDVARELTVRALIVHEKIQRVDRERELRRIHLRGDHRVIDVLEPDARVSVRDQEERLVHALEGADIVFFDALARGGGYLGYFFGVKGYIDHFPNSFR